MGNFSLKQIIAIAFGSILVVLLIVLIILTVSSPKEVSELQPQNVDCDNQVSEKFEEINLDEEVEMLNLNESEDTNDIEPVVTLISEETQKIEMHMFKRAYRHFLAFLCPFVAISGTGFSV